MWIKEDDKGSLFQSTGASFPAAVEVCTHWYLEQVELAMDGSNGWKVTGGLCSADIRKPMANKLRLKHVPVEKKNDTLDMKNDQGSIDITD